MSQQLTFEFACPSLAHSVERLVGWMRCQKAFNPWAGIYSVPELLRWARHLSADPSDVMTAWERVFLNPANK